jgi:hypothetical protein
MGALRPYQRHDTQVKPIPTYSTPVCVPISGGPAVADTPTVNPAIVRRAVTVTTSPSTVQPTSPFAADVAYAATRLLPLVGLSFEQGETLDDVEAAIDEFEASGGASDPGAGR